MWPHTKQKPPLASNRSREWDSGHSDDIVGEEELVDYIITYETG